MLTCQSNDGNRQYATNAFSGGSSFESIISGTYKLVEAQGKKSNFFSLSRGRMLDLMYMATGKNKNIVRGGFMLHPGSESEGCITVKGQKNKDDYNSISDLISSELSDSTLEVTGD